MDMKKFMDAVKEPSRIEKTDAKDMHRFLSIVTEGKNTTTNRLSMAEQMAVQQYTPETKKNITNPVLNVSKDAKPSMIGKYFKAVEEEIAEAQERTKDRAKLIAERVISKMHSASKQRIEEYYNVPATDSKSPIPGHVSGCQCKEVEEGLKDPKDNPCWKGYKPVGTKKKGGRTVPNCVPKEGVTEETDPNKLAASVTLDGEFKEFDLTPLIAKNNWVGAPKQVINLADKYLGDFFRKRGSAYSNLEITYKGTTLKANQVGDVDAPDLEFESMQDVTEDWMDDMRAMAHKMAPQDKMRERQAERAAQEKLERQQRIQQDIENLPDLISQYNDMEAEYDSMGGSNWQYADSEQNLSDEERRARNMETSMRQLANRIHTAKTAKNKDLAEGDSGAKYKVRSIGHDAKGDYYISPSTGKKVYKKGVKVGDHENPKTGEHKGVAENKADGINKMFNNLGDPVYANLQRVALLAMQGRQQEASGRLQTVIKDADPDVQKKITDAVNNIKPVTINGKIADSSRLDKSKQHNDWIINTFIPWVQSLLGKQGVAEGLNEFAPGNGGGESGRWYTDDQMTDIVGDGWYQDLDVSGDIPKQQMIQQAQAWLADQGYSVQVLNCKVNDDDMEWYIEGSFQNSGFAKKGMAEGSEQKYLWHGSRQKIPMLEPRQSVDTGGAAGSNQNAIYATSDPKVAIAVGGLTTPDSDTAMFPNDPQMVLFSGKIRKGENVYLHKLPFYSPDGKPQFVRGAHDREFYSIPGVKGIKPTEIKAVPVDKYLNLIRKATPADLELRKKNMKEQGVAEGGPKGYDSDGNPLGGGYDEYENNWVVTIDGKTWKTFDDERQAYKAAAAIERKYGKKTRVYKN